MIRGLTHPRLVVVSGAGSGIGRATALAFADGDATVVAADVNELTSKETVTLIRQRGGVAYSHVLDVTDSHAWDRFGADVRTEHGIPDVVVNNAGIAIAGSFLDQTDEDWTRQLAINLSGVVHGCRVFAAQMVERGQGGHIVNVASLAAYSPAGLAPSYCVSKAGVKMLSESLRSELAADGIGVTAICPGLINTNIANAGTLTGIDAELDDLFHRVAQRYMPVLGADPSHVARAIVRAVRHNWAIVPVRPEAWLTYGLSRLSPRMMRAFTERFTGNSALDGLVRIVPNAVLERLAA